MIDERENAEQRGFSEEVSHAFFSVDVLYNIIMARDNQFRQAIFFNCSIISRAKNCLTDVT